MFNRIKFLRVIAISVVGIGIAFAMQTSSSAEPTRNLSGVSSNYGNSGDIYVGDDVYFYVTVAYLYGDVPQQSQFNIYDGTTIGSPQSLNEVPVTITNPADCVPPNGVLVPRPAAGVVIPTKTYCWKTHDLIGGLRSVHVNFSGNNTYLPAPSVFSIFVSKPTPTVEISTVTNNAEENAEPTPSASPSDSLAPVPSLPSPTPTSSSSPTPVAMPDPTSSAIPVPTKSANAYANKGDTVDITATVYWNHSGTTVPSGKVYFYQQDPDYPDAGPGNPNSGGGMPIHSVTGEYGCDLSNTTAPSNINGPTLTLNTISCTITVNASDLNNVAGDLNTAIGTHGLVAVYVGDLPVRVPNHPTENSHYDLMTSLHGICGETCTTDPASYMTNAHFGADDRLLFETISGDDTLGDSNFTGAVSGYGNIPPDSTDAFSQGATFLLNIYRGWAHVSVSQSPSESTEYGEEVTFNLQVAGSASIGSEPTITSGSLGVKLTEINANAPPIYLYCDADSATTTPGSYFSTCSISTVLLHPIKDYLVDAFYMGDSNYQPTTYLGLYGPNNQRPAPADLADYLTNYFYVPSNPEDVNPDTVDTQDLTIANNDAWDNLFVGNDQVAQYNFFNDADDYPDPQIVRSIVSAEPAIDITPDSASETLHYGEVAGFTVTISNPNSDNTSLDYPDGTVSLSSDFGDWSVDCEVVTRENAVSTYHCSSPLLLAGDHEIYVHFDSNDDNYTSSDSVTTVDGVDAANDYLEYTVEPYEPTVTIFTNPDTTEYGQTVTFTVTVVGTENDLVLPPVGTVVLSSEEQPEWVAPTCVLQESNVNDYNQAPYSATYTCQGADETLLANTHTITAEFTPEDSAVGANYVDASGTVEYTVEATTPTITVNSEEITTKYGEDAHFTVEISNPNSDNTVLDFPEGDVTLTTDFSDQPDGWSATCQIDEAATEATGTVTSVYNCESHTLFAGDHTLTVHFDSTNENYSSTTQEFSYTVEPYEPVVTVTSDTATNYYGDPVTFTVTVVGDDNLDVLPPSGTVILKSSEQPDWEGPTCEYVTSTDINLLATSSTYTCQGTDATLLGDIHQITAEFTPDDSPEGNNYTEASSEELTYTVDPVEPLMSVEPSDSTHYGETATFYITVEHPDPVDGLVKPTEGLTLTSDLQTGEIGSCVIDESAGDATQTIYKCDSTELIAGTHQLTASYEGDDNYQAKSLLLDPFVVQLTDPEITISQDTEESKYGEEVSFTVEVTNPYSTEDILDPSGRVWLTTNNEDQNAEFPWELECTLESGSDVPTTDGSSTYNCETPLLLANIDPHTLTVNYAGDSNYSSSADSLLEPTTTELQVDPYTPEVTLTQSESSTEYGDIVTFTVTVAGTDNEGVQAPEGTVTITATDQPEDWQIVCENGTSEASTFTCSVDAATLLAGEHEITATFTPNDSVLGYNYAEETDDITHEVELKTPGIGFEAGDPIHYGETATFTVTLSGTTEADSPESGSVVLAPIGGELTITSDDQEDWSAPCTLNEGALSGSQAQYTCTSTTLLASNDYTNSEHHLVATYEGDDNYTSVEDTAVQTILKTDLVITLEADQDSTEYGQEAGFTVELTNPYSTEGIEAPEGHVWLTTNDEDQNNAAAGPWIGECTTESDSNVNGLSTYHCESPLLYAADHALTVHYAGDDNYSNTEGESTLDWTTLEYTVEAYTPEVTVTADQESTKYGDPVTFTVTLVGTENEGVLPPSGTVVLTSSEQEDWELTCTQTENGSDSVDSTYTCDGTSGTLLADDHTIIATFTPDDSPEGANYTEATGDMDYTVERQDPLMTISADPDSTNNYGEETTFTVTVAGTDYVDSPETGSEVVAPTGDVVLTDTESDWTIDCESVSGDPVNGYTYTCSGTSPLLSVGSHNIVASYEGDDNYEPATVEYESYGIDLFTPEITVEVDSEPAVYGDEQTITVTITGSGNEDVTPPTPQTITLSDPSGNWSYTGVPSCEENTDSITLVCTVTTTRLFAGQYQINASYEGDENYYGVEGTSSDSVNISPAVLAVSPSDTTVSIDYGSTTIPALNATIEGFVNGEDAGVFVPGVATEFPNGENGTETTVDGRYEVDSTTWYSAPTCAPVNLFKENGEMVDAGTPGVYYNCGDGLAHNYVFEYTGNAGITIRKTTAQLQLTSNLVNSTYGQNVELTVRLENNSGLSAESTVIDFTYGDEQYLGACTLGQLSRNACVLPTKLLPVGTNTVTASWNGPADINFDIPKAVTIVITVEQAPVTIEVTSDRYPAAHPEEYIVFSATVTGTATPPTGSVTIIVTARGTGVITPLEGVSCVASGENQSVCTADGITLPIDIYDVVATYADEEDANYLGNSDSLVQLVQSEFGQVEITQTSPTSDFADADHPAQFTVVVHGDPSSIDVWPTGSVVITDNNRVYTIDCQLEHIVGTSDSTCDMFSIIGMELGVHQIRATYSGDRIFDSSTDTISHHVVIPTGVAITSSKNPSFEGDEVTFTATVSSERGSPSDGHIVFKEGVWEGDVFTSVRTLDECALDYSSTCSITVSDLPADETHQVAAFYVPDEASDFNESSSAPLAQHVIARVATVSVTQNIATTFAGQVVDFTVHVEGNDEIATGTVEVSITPTDGTPGSVITYECTLANGFCTVGTSTLPSGTYAVTATYAGNYATVFLPEAATEHTVLINETGVVVTSSKAHAFAGDSITLTANVASDRGVPTSGTIQFKDNGVDLGEPCQVEAGICSITTSELRATESAHAITATFTPDAEDILFSSETSEAFSQYVTALAVTLTVTQNISHTFAGQVANFTINAVGNSYVPTGVVHLSITAEDVSETLGCTLANGHCTVGIDSLPHGEYTVVASYDGENPEGYPAVDHSESIKHWVDLYGTFVQVTSSINQSVHYDNIMLTATVASEHGVPASGSIDFYEWDGAPASLPLVPVGSALLGHCQITAGTCSIFINSLSVGHRGIVARFTPEESSIFSGKDSDEYDQLVVPAVATVTVSSNLNPALVGQLVTFTVNVTGNSSLPQSLNGSASISITSHAGNVYPMDDTLTCTPVVNGHCSVSIYTLDAGLYEVTATFIPNNIYDPETSDPITQEIDEPSVNVSAEALSREAETTHTENAVTHKLENLDDSSNENVVLRARIIGNAGPITGTVTFYVDGKALSSSSPRCVRSKIDSTHYAADCSLTVKASVLHATNPAGTSSSTDGLGRISVTHVVTVTYNGGGQYPSTSTLLVSGNELVSEVYHFINVMAPAHTVNFNGNSTDSRGSMTPESYSVRTPLTANAFTRAGYHFTGWNTQADGLGGTANSYADLADYDFTSDVTLYAQWAANTLTVTFDSQGGSTVADGTTTTDTKLVSVSSDPTRTGYAFLGWFVSATGGSAVNLASPGYVHGQTSNFTLFAHWSANSYNITWQDGSGVTSSSRGGSTVYVADQSVVAIPTVDPIKTGYTFDGWFTDAPGGVKITNGSHTPASPYSDKTFFAHWTAISTNPVMYNNVDATTAQTGGSTTYTTGSSITTVPTVDPSKTGYTFAGWYTAASGGILVTNGSYTPASPYGAVTLFAHWTSLADVTVTFLGNGETSGSTADQSAHVTTVLRANGFVKTGYTFDGWSLVANGEVVYAPGVTYPFNADITLYAHWTLIPPAMHTVTFDGNTSTGGSTAAQSANAPTALTINGFTKPGFTFDGWATSSGGAVVYANSATYSFASNTTLFAHWTVIPAAMHTVQFDGNSLDTTGSMTNQTANTSTTLNSNGFALAGWTFEGWNTQANGSGTPYADGFSYSFASNVTLYAQWSQNSAVPNTVTFDGNNETGGSTADVSNSDPAALTLNGFAKTGYTFAGWTTNSDGTGMSYTDGEIYDFATDLNLFAKWTADTLTVTYDSNGGSAINGVSTTVTGGILTAAAGVTTWEGHTFEGWFFTRGTGTAVNWGGAHNKTADFTIYAHWHETVPAASHTVTFNGNANNTSGSMTSQVANSSTFLTTNAFTRPGYYFAGWNTVAGGSGTGYADGVSYNFTSDVTLYAQWTANPAPTTYTVTFNANLGTGTMDPQVASTTTVLNANAFSRSGYTFDGWSQVADGAVIYAPGVTYPFNADITLYAHWLQNYVAPAPYSPPPAPTPSATTPVLAWANPASIVVGTALSSVQLNATVTSPAGLSGTYAYSPAAGSLLAAGTYTLTVVFTPTDLVNYTTATKTVTLIVTPLGSTPVNPSGPAAATINLGDGSGTYNGSGHAAPVSISPANCTYTVTYNGSTAVPVNAGSYNVIVTAYGNCTGTATRTLVIAKATPNIDWVDPANITTTTPLSSTQLNATSDVPGTFAYSPAAKQTLPAGTQILGATFTPTDSANYESVNVNATIKVNAVVISQTIVSFFALASSTIPADQLTLISSASITPGQQIVITGYAQPSNNAAADLKLGLARANAVKAQILKKNPKAKITVKTLGSKYQPLCAKALNKCVVIVLK